MFNYFKRRKKLYYIVEDADWSIKQDGLYITHYLKKNFHIDARTSVEFENIKKSVVHFGSRNVYLPKNFGHIHKSNSIIFTWFHGTAEDTSFIQSLPEGSKKASVIHTSCETSKNQLIKWGAEEKKIVVIPIGIDLDLFRPVSQEIKITAKRQLGIPDDVVVIGSFQKDGVGWGEGNDPKLIKGPDIFCSAVESLSKKYTVFIFLTGPARGYVKNRLRDSDIPFKHVYMREYKDVARLFPLLDLYIVTSRVEGGPKAILESLASGVPLVSTKVGMAADILTDGKNALLVEAGDVEGIIRHAEKIITTKSIRENLIKHGLDLVKQYEISNIVRRCFEEIYFRFL